VISDIGGSFAYLLRPGARSRLGLARGVGSSVGSTGGAAAWLLIEGGHGELQIDGETTVVDGREDVFDRAGWSGMIPPKTRFAVRGALRYTLAWRAWSKPAEVGLLKPDEVDEVLESETGPRVRTYVAEGPLRCGETLLVAGAWSSLPGHEHEQEEVHVFRVDPIDGFGVQLLSTRDGALRGDVVRDGNVRRVRSGPHPVVVGPGATMCCIWVRADPSRHPEA
jgi:5-deoxy-glucuronate isomerase